MILETACTKLAITNLLVKDYPTISSAITTACSDAAIEVVVIEGAADYWCRDFMPLQVNENHFVQFIFDPAYYKHPGFQHLRTDIKKLHDYPNVLVENIGIVLDGGNVCYTRKKAIITDRLFKDNPGISRNDLISRIALLDIEELVIIPSLTYDITGHADGMVRFINEDTLFLNDFRTICSKSYWERLLKSHKKFNIILLPNDLHLNKNTDDATGDYLNMVLIKDLALTPAYGNSTDDAAYKIIQSQLPELLIVPIPCKELAKKGGVLHCATWNLY